MIGRLVRRLGYLLGRGRHLRELAEEMDFHRSMTGARAFGNVTLAREDARGIWVWRWVEEAWQDARFTVRSMLRQPGFALAAIAIVALGAGATTCVFGLLDALVVRSLPVERPDRLVWFSKPSFSYPIFREVYARMPVFDGIFGWNIDRAYVDWTGQGRELAPADVLETTGEFFSTLHVRTAVGRTFDSRDVAVAVLSHTAWKRHFGSDASAVGRAIHVGDVPLTIVGVAPAGFFGVTPGLEPEVIVPIAARHAASDFRATTSSWLHLMGRLKDGVGLPQAEAVVQAVWPRVMESTVNPGMPANRQAIYLGRTTSLEPGRTGFSPVRNQYGDPLRLLMALVGLLLAIACASVANLLLARGIARRKEIAVRLAIGAGRARVFRQLVTESLVLTLAGAAIGLVLASWAGGLLVAFLTTSREQFALDTAPGWRTAGFSLGLALVVSLLSALLPAIDASRGDMTGGLKAIGQPGSGFLRQWSAGKVLVALQVALALVLLAGAAVFGRSLARVLAQDTGLDADRVLVVSTDAAAAGYHGPALRAFDFQLLEKLRALPGVETAALSWMPPISNTMGNWTQSITIDGVQPQDQSRSVYFNGMSPDYFETVGMSLRRGRDVRDTDTAAAPKIVIVNETLARQFFPGQDPIGHRIGIGKAASRKDLEIIGIVQDAKYRTLQEPARAVAYLSLVQVEDVTTGRDLFAEVRAASLPAAGAAARQAVRTIDPRVPVRTEAVADRIRESTLTERLVAILAGALGAAALALACAGLYGLFAYTIARHSREIGLRIALGARPASVLWMVQRESLVLAGLGIAVGLGGALALGRFVRSMLFQVTPDDPVALGIASAVLLAAVSAAAYVPARRAASVDPVVALKRDS
ncbi:MAG TPA: ADOP family duplicated permease [Vicinamibacterales bacterium]